MKRSLSPLLLVFFALACAGQAHPNEEVLTTGLGISGQVRDAAGNALAEVRVTTDPPTQAAMTDKDGRFSLVEIDATQAVIPPGRYRLLFYKLGWWRGAEVKPIFIDFPGGDLMLPEVMLVPIAAAELNELGIPEDGREALRGAGVVRDGE